MAAEPQFSERRHGAYCLEVKGERGKLKSERCSGGAKELNEVDTMRKIGISDFSTKPTNFYNLRRQELF